MVASERMENRYAKAITDGSKLSFPKYGACFIARVDCRIGYVDNPIETFRIKDKDPPIVVSVICLNTVGPVSAIWNAVFF